MSEIVVDSSVVAKWVLPELDTPQANRLLTHALTTGDRLVVLDLAFAEVANAIWNRQRRNLISADDARQALAAVVALPVRVEPASPRLQSALEIGMKYDRAIYDALFVATADELNVQGVTADEPLVNA
jgi:predicted nucleic acid-binding protein